MLLAAGSSRLAYPTTSSQGGRRPHLPATAPSGRGPAGNPRLQYGRRHTGNRRRGCFPMPSGTLPGGDQFERDRTLADHDVAKTDVGCGLLDARAGAVVLAELEGLITELERLTTRAGCCC